MAKPCDHKSVGTLIRNKRRRLAIWRGNHPAPSLSIPAGHLDLGSYVDMAVIETAQETGLMLPMRDLALVYEGTLANPCKREGGSWHDWRVYSFLGKLPTTKLRPGDDVPYAFWATEEEWYHFATRTEWFYSKLGLSWVESGTLTLKIFGHPDTGPVTDEEKSLHAEWLRYPGMEPACYFMMRMIGEFPWTFQNAPVGLNKELRIRNFGATVDAVETC